MDLGLARALLCLAARLKSKELSHAAGMVCVHLQYECKDESEKAKYRCTRCEIQP